MITLSYFGNVCHGDSYFKFESQTPNTLFVSVAVNSLGVFGGLLKTGRFRISEELHNFISLSRTNMLGTEIAVKS